MVKNIQKCNRCNRPISFSSKILCTHHLQLQRESFRKYYKKNRTNKKWLGIKNERQRERYKRSDIKQKVKNHAQKLEVKIRNRLNAKKRYAEKRKNPKWIKAKNAYQRLQYAKKLKEI